LRTCEEALAKLNRKLPFRNAVSEAINNAKQQTGPQGKSKAIVLLRKALETLISELQHVGSFCCSVYEFWYIGGYANV
jgi:hypothetical protein